MPTDVNTICFHTRDVVARDDSSLTFRMPSDRLHPGAFKVSLASCEFPMVQWTIEEDWNRLYVHEGIWFDTPGANEIPVAIKRAGEAEAELLTLRLPPRLNRVRHTERRNDGTLVVTCERPHCLWQGARLLRSYFTSPLLAPSLLAGNMAGDVALGGLADALEYVSPTQLAVRGLCAAVGDHATHLLTPPVPSITRLCAHLSEAAREATPLGVRLAFTYDATCDTLRATGIPSSDAVLVRFLPCPLAHACGLSTAPLRFGGAGGALVWPAEPTHLWDYVEMPGGFYSPCHRPMCTGQPLKFGAELESALNRLYFPLTGVSGGGVAPHLLVFADPDGRILSCAIPNGRYTPERLCLHLEAAMTNAAVLACPGVVYSVHRDGDRFVFACERTGEDGVLHPSVFQILFHHAQGIDPSRLGFHPQPLVGSHTYVAPCPTRVATATPVGCERGGNARRHTANLVRVGDVAAQKRFELQTAQPPLLLAAVLGGGGGRMTTRTVRVRTHVGGRPFAHGLQPGDVVRAVPSAAVTMALEDGTDAELRETVANVPARCTLVVGTPSSGGGDAGDDDPCILHLEAPAHLGGLSDEGTCFHVLCEVQPWNVCFCKPRTLPAHLLGFPEAAVQWGVDGSVGDLDGTRLPPFVAPHTHCLDHPDYVLLLFSEAGGSGLTHTYDGEARHVFCKLSLYPLFREERMLPRDTTLQRSNVATFTLSFWNPDLRTPYRFHGAEFSFSLSFLSFIPDPA